MIKNIKILICVISLLFLSGIALATSITSTGSGNWSSTTADAPWPGGTVPTSSDDVTIANGHTVTIDANASCNSLTVGQGTSGILQFEVNTARTITVTTDVTINSGGTFKTASSGDVTADLLSLGGDLTNNGTLDFSTFNNTVGAEIRFTGSNNSTFSGTGGTTDLRLLSISKSSINNTVTISPSVFTVRGSAADGSWDLLANSSGTTTGTGTYKFSGTFSFSHRLINTSGYTISSTIGIWLDNPNFAVVGQSNSVTNNGIIRITNGTYNVGIASGNSIGAGAGAVFTIEGGALNVTGRLRTANAVTYTQSNGTVSVSTVGNSSSSDHSFQLSSSSSTINMTGGTIILVQRATGSTTPRLDYNVAGTGTFTGTTLQVGSGATATNFDFGIRGNIPNLVIDNTTNNKSALLINTANVYGSATINTNTTLDLNGYGITFRGAINNSGTITANASGSGITFQGTSAQSIGGTLTSGQIYNMTVNNASGVTLNTNATVTNSLTLTSGPLNVGASKTLTLNITPSRTSGSLTSDATGTVNYAQGSDGQTVLDGTYGNLTFSNYNKTLSSTGTIAIAGTFTTGSASGHTTTGSTINFNGAGQTVPVFSYNNLTLSGSGTKTAGGSLTMTGALTNSVTLDMAGNTLSVTGSITNTGATIRFNGASNGLAVPTGTIEYYGTTQTVATGTYATLNITATGTKTAAGAITATTLDNGGASDIAAILDMAGYTLSATTIENTNATIRFSGASNGLAVGTGTIEYYGSGQTVATGTYNNLTIYQTSDDVTLDGTSTVNGTLTLTSGNVITGDNILIISSTGSVSRTSGHIVGNLKKYITSTKTAVTFEIGDADNYTPVNVTISGITTPGYLTAKTTGSEHPNIGSSEIDASKSVNRYWTLTNTGIAFSSYDATFNFVAGDIDGGANYNNFIVGKKDVSWSYPTVGTKTATSTQATGMTAFSDFAIGEHIPVPTKLAIISVNGGASPTAGIPFNVGVQSQDALGVPTNVTQNTNILLSKATGTGILGGTLTGTITMGTNQATVTGVTYDTPEAGVSITATRTSGDVLTPGTSATFTVLASYGPTHLAIVSVNGGVEPTAGLPFDVVVQSQDALGNPSDVTGATDIELTKATGTGLLGGTLIGQIADGTNQITISGVTYDVAEAGVSITASDVTTKNLLPGTSVLFTVLAGAATQLVITSVNGGLSPTINIGFDVVVQSQDASGNPANVTRKTKISLSKATGTGNLGGTLTGTILVGTNQVTIPVVTYDSAEAGVSITATRTSGDPLIPGTSALFSVITSWTMKEDVPQAGDVRLNKFVKDGGSLVKATVPLTETDVLYAFPGNRSHEFYKYVPGAPGVWSTEDTTQFGYKYPRPAPPALPIINKKKIGKGAALCFDGNHTIYATKGNNTHEFWAYDMNAEVDHRWTLKEDVPSSKALKGGTSICWYNGKVYLLAGGQRNDEANNFFVYNPTQDIWMTLDGAPRHFDVAATTTRDKSWRDGSCIVVMGENVNAVIYALKGGDKYNFLCTYNVGMQSPTWSTNLLNDTIPYKYPINLVARPWKSTVKDGGAMTTDGSHLYAIKGGGKQDFWEYTPGGNPLEDWWTPLEIIPRQSGLDFRRSVPKTGAALAYANDAVWLMKGNNRQEFWKYMPVSVSAVKTVSVIPSVVATEMSTPTTKLSFNIITTSLSNTIRYTVPVSGNVSIKLYNATGQLVKTLVNGYQNTGSYTFEIGNSTFEISSGIYFLKYSDANNSSEIKLIVQ